MDGFAWLMAMTLIIVSLAFYFLPTIIAFTRPHRNTLAIGALNLLLGWTVLGWICALIWALTAPADEPVPVRVRSGSQRACPGCGLVTDATAKFCTGCGRQLA